MKAKIEKFKKVLYNLKWILRLPCGQYNPSPDTTTFSVHAAGKIAISNIPGYQTGNPLVIGFTFGVEWGMADYAGGVLERDEARRLAEFILKKLDETADEWSDTAVDIDTDAGQVIGPYNGRYMIWIYDYEFKYMGCGNFYTWTTRKRVGGDIITVGWGGEDAGILSGLVKKYNLSQVLDPYPMGPEITIIVPKQYKTD